MRSKGFFFFYRENNCLKTELVCDFAEFQNKKNQSTRKLVQLKLRCSINLKTFKHEHVSEERE